MSAKALRAMYEACAPQWNLSPEGRKALAEVKGEIDALEANEAKRAQESRLFEAKLCGDTVRVELFYPRSDGHPKFVEVGICDVRANDGARLSYDFEEDGFRVEQPTSRVVFVPDTSSALGGGLECRETWTQVFFAQSWALELSDEEKIASEDAALEESRQHRAALKGKR